MSLEKKEIQSLNWKETAKNTYSKSLENGEEIIFQYSKGQSRIFKKNNPQEDIFSGSIPDRFHLESIMMDKMIPFS